MFSGVNVNYYIKILFKGVYVIFILHFHIKIRFVQPLSHDKPPLLRSLCIYYIILLKQFVSFTALKMWGFSVRSKIF